jgi:hypothetical protein
VGRDALREQRAAAPCGVRLPPQTLRVTTAGRIACSLFRLPVGRLDVGAVQAREARGPPGLQMVEEALSHRRPPFGARDIRARQKEEDCATPTAVAKRAEQGAATAGRYYGAWCV